MKKKIFIIFALIIAMTATLCGCGKEEKIDVTPDRTTSDKDIQVSEEETTTEEETTAEPEIDPITISLVSVGDMLMHTSANNPALQADGTYNYDYLFANVRDAIASADVAIANNEVVMAGNEIGNIGYPCFNVRTELGNAEVNAGFDDVLLATNHALDQDVSGLLNCVNFWKTNFPQIGALGAHASAEEAAEIHVQDVGGIKIAMLNYTYGTNGIELPADYSYALDMMTEGTKDKIAQDIAKAKELADFVIVFPHWGTEYNLGISDEQKSWAQFFADNGVDLVIGTHPHVVEPVEYVTGVNGNQMLVYYSLGNFVSVQYYNYCMLGGMAQVSITKDSTGTYISDYGMKFLVTHYTSGRAQITTYFLDDYTDELAAQHAILFEPGEDFMEVNKSYPFTVEGLKALAKQICPDLCNY